MHFAKLIVAFGIMAMLSVSATLAAERGTPEEAKVLAEKGAAHLSAVGVEKAIADFNDPASGYQDRDLFIFVYSAEGKILCAPGVPALVGRDATALKDVNGKEFGKMIMAAAAGGSGWVDYQMSNPALKKTEPKRSYVVKAGDYVLGSGAYNP